MECHYRAVQNYWLTQYFPPVLYWLPDARLKVELKCCAQTSASFIVNALNNLNGQTKACESTPHRFNHKKDGTRMIRE